MKKLSWKIRGQRGERARNPEGFLKVPYPSSQEARQLSVGTAGRDCADDQAASSLPELGSTRQQHSCQAGGQAIRAASQAGCHSVSLPALKSASESSVSRHPVRQSVSRDLVSLTVHQSVVCWLFCEG